MLGGPQGGGERQESVEEAHEATLQRPQRTLLQGCREVVEATMCI